MNRLLILLAFLACAFAAPTKRDVPSFVYPEDAPYSVDPDTLAAALTCPHGNPSAESPPILLVHGTGADGNQTWNYTYVPALLADGFTACYVDLRKWRRMKTGRDSSSCSSPSRYRYASVSRVRSIQPTLHLLPLWRVAGFSHHAQSRWSSNVVGTR